jgi:VIT1/CCC1 family predicted Fe2+/Mn2+ transporter
MALAHTLIERHFISRVGWLRAAVLGANDGIISVASLIAGVAATQAEKSSVLVTGLAALAAGALSMAAGEYVSVSSQADTEYADLAREERELSEDPGAELAELTAIYVARGLSTDLATEVARQLTDHNALQAHARDELGLYDHMQAKPVQAALTSAATFAAGGLMPILVLVVSPQAHILPAVSLSALALLGVLGAVGAKAGGSNLLKAVVRVVVWGGIALTVTGLVGHLFGAAG